MKLLIFRLLETFESSGRFYEWNGIGVVNELIQSEGGWEMLKREGMEGETVKLNSFWEVV